MKNIVFAIKRIENVFMESNHKEVVAVFRNPQQFDSLYNFYLRIKNYLSDDLDYHFDIINIEDADNNKLLKLEENVSDWNFSYTAAEVYPLNNENKKIVEKAALQLQKEDPEKNVNIDEVLIKDTLTRKEIVEVFFENYYQDVGKYEFLKFLSRSLKSGDAFKKENSYKYNHQCFSYNMILSQENKYI